MTVASVKRTAWMGLAVLCAACSGATTPTATQPGLSPILAFDEGGWIRMWDGAEVWDVVPGERPAWSPDGQRIAFVRDAGASEDLYVADADGANVQALLVDDIDDDKPVWSPDGSEIAFVRGDETDEIWTIRPDGTGLTQRTFLEGKANDPDWGPNGLIFQDEDAAPWVSYMMPSVGSEPEPLVDAEIFENDFDWGPGGALVYSAFPEGNDNEEIFWVGTPGDKPVRLTEDPASDDEASIDPTGSRVVFDSDRGGLVDLWVMPVGGGDPEPLLDVPGGQDRQRGAWRP